MNKEKMLKIIRQIEISISGLKSEIIEKKDLELLEKDENLKNTDSRKRRSKNTDLVSPIKKLFDDGMFSDWVTDLDIVNKLKISLLTSVSPKRSSVTNVLRRMVKNGLLRRDKIAEGKKKVIRYKIK